MGDFFTGPPPNSDFPVPPGQDSFDVPPPNFRLIGQALGSGLKDAGVFAAAAGSLLETVAKGLAYVLGWILSKLLCIVAFLIDFINRVDDAAAPGMDAVIRNSLAHVFNLPAVGGGPRKLASSVDAGAAADAVGHSIIDALTAGVGQGAGGAIQPTDQPAAQFLGKLARIGVEGWLEGTITEAVTLGQVDAVLQLVPIMADVLGLGRLSRRVLAPPLKIMVEDPYTWLLNMRFRPTLLAHDQAVRQFLRGRMDRGELDTELGRQGFSSSAIEALININSKFIPQGDVSFLDTHGLWSHDVAVQEMLDQGWDRARAETVLAMEQNRQVEVYRRQLLADNIEAFQRGEVDEGQLEAAIDASGIPDFEKGWVRQIAEGKRLATPKHLTLGEVETLIKAHIMSLDDLRAWMTRENYPPDEQTLLELWLFGKILSADQAAKAKADAAAAKAAAAAAKAAKQQQTAAAATAKLAGKPVSLATFEQLVEQGQRTFDDFRAFLTAQGFAPAAITDLVDLLHAKITAKQTLQQQHDALTAEADQKHIPLSQTEKAVTAGVLGIPDLIKFMTDNEYAPADIQIATAYVEQQLNAAKAKAAAKSGATAAAATKQISLPELERAARLGLVTVADYAAALDAAGFDPASRDLMVGIINAQLATDAATLKTRKAANAAGTKRKISLVKLEQAVLAGIRPMSDYQNELSLLGFSPEDQAALVDLLQLRVDHAADVAKAKAAATDKLKARNVSLGDLEAAVKEGITTIDEYRAQLAQDGFSPADQELLATSLLAEIAAARKSKPIATLPTAPAPPPPA